MQHAFKVKEKTEENTKQSDLLDTHQESYSCDNPIHRQVHLVPPSFVRSSWCSTRYEHYFQH